MLPIYSKGGGVLSHSQSRSGALLHHHRVWPCFSLYCGAFNEIEGGSAILAKLVETALTICTYSDVVVGQQLQRLTERALESAIRKYHPDLICVPSWALARHEMTDIALELCLSRWTCLLTRTATCPLVIGWEIKLLIYPIRRDSLNCAPSNEGRGSIPK